ncbi:uncharacterized protein LOC144859102 [Branchiostoma floridae x Branchiostoma japonicum]
MNRAREAVHHTETSRTKLYDVRLMANINNMSMGVLGEKLLPEFSPPGKPTDELIAIQYLLAQSGRGDLNPSVVRDDDVGNLLPELNLEEANEEDNVDATVCLAEHIRSENSEGLSEVVLGATAARGTATSTSSCDVLEPPWSSTSSCDVLEPPGSSTSSCDVLEPPEPSTSSQDDQESQYDARGVPGWEAVDNLAAYLLCLDLSATALSAAEANNIVALYAKLSDCDKGATKYKRKAKQGVVRQGSGWRASRKRDPAAPGVQGCERLYMTHGQAAQCPSTNRVSECLCLRLMRKFDLPRNRPNDATGKRLPHVQSIVHTYGIVQQLLADSRVVQEKTNIVLVVINNTTVSAW